MFTYQVDPEVSLAIPRPAVDAGPLFQLIEEDRDELSKWLQWVDNVQSVDNEKRFLELQMIRFGQGRLLNTVIYYRDEIAGMISFNGFRAMDDSADIGYWLGQQFVGNGIMHRAVLGMCQIGFNDYNLNKIVINAVIENEHSNNVAMNAGFHFDGRLRENEFLQGRYHDENRWSLLRSEWFG